MNKERTHHCKENTYKDVEIRYEAINSEEWSWVMNQWHEGEEGGEKVTFCSHYLLITHCPFCGVSLDSNQPSHIGSTELVKAETIARKAHEGQYRKDGSPYIQHVEKVVIQLQGDPEAQAVAWLHDVLEDTDMTTKDLLSQGISPKVVEVVTILTQKREQRFKDYIDLVSSHKLATKVKKADLIANLSDKPGTKQTVKFAQALLSLCGKADKKTN